MLKIFLYFVLLVQSAACFACSMIATQSEGENLVGRNFDYSAGEQSICFHSASDNHFAFVGFD